MGKLSANPYDPDSVSNPFGLYGSLYSPNSVKNPYSRHGFEAQNPYSLGGPKIIGQDGTYLGRLNRNKYDPESVSNPYGIYGSKYSPFSVKNPYSIYGSEYSPFSATNPYTTQAPKLYGTSPLQLGSQSDLDTGGLFDFGLDGGSDP
jgi:hypothetical protein